MNSLRVLIVDEHVLVRNGLKQVFAEEYRGVVFGEARTADEALAQVETQPWDLVLLDIAIPGKDGFDVLQAILLRRPRTPVLMLSNQPNPPNAAGARQVGALGYVSKDAGRSDLVKAFNDVLAGKLHFGESAPRKSTPPTPDGRPSLSAREYEVLLAFASGKRTGEIATGLSLSTNTVSTYKRRILNKLCLKSTADLVRYVIDHRLS